MDKTDFLTHIRSFTNIQDVDVQSDDTIMGWVYMAESAVSETLRIADMVQIDTATIGVQNRVPGPSDFIAADFIYNNTAETPVNWRPRTDFYLLTSAQRSNLFTQTGNYLTFGGDVEGDEIELHYFGDVPHLTDDATWLSTRFNALLTGATLAVASMAMEEPDKAISWQASVSSQIGALNDRYKASLASGSKLSRTIRGFG